MVFDLNAVLGQNLQGFPTDLQAEEDYCIYA
jgi:hypothetical protein